MPPRWRTTTAATVSAFGVIVGAAGIEHGIGEVLQGDVAPRAVVIESWPESEVFRVLGGEPAMTIVPSLLVTGILAIAASLVFLVCAVTLVARRAIGPILISLSIGMLLVGAGFGPPLLGLVLGATATRVRTPPSWIRTRLPAGVRAGLARLWPWCFAAALIAWLAVLPGIVLFDRLARVDDPALVVPVLTFTALGLLLATILSAFARDSRDTGDLHP